MAGRRFQFNTLVSLSAAALLLGLVAAGMAWGTHSRQDARAPLEERLRRAERRLTRLSQSYRVAKIYPSMTGPWSSQALRVGADDPLATEGRSSTVGPSSTAWITGYGATMVAADGETPMPQDFMCHSNLDVDRHAHTAAMGTHPSFSSRLFTLSQGQLEIEFPRGFGIPVKSTEKLDLTTQVLNLNHRGAPLQVRHRVTVSYALNDEVGPGMVPLMPIAAYGLALTQGQDGYYGVETPDAETHGPGCLVAETASDHEYSDGMGRDFSGHWQVPPGRQVNHTLVTRLMQVPFETTVHYIAVHLHPFAESLTLRDLTDDRVLFESRAENFPDRVGLAKVDAYSSREGLLIYPDHEYELVSVYNNTSGETQDSMAVMYLYLRDRGLEKRLEQGGTL